MLSEHVELPPLKLKKPNEAREEFVIKIPPTPLSIIYEYNPQPVGDPSEPNHGSVTLNPSEPNQGSETPDPLETTQGSGTLDFFPDEILARIFSFLQPEDVARCSETCQRFYRISHDTTMWHELSLTNNWHKYDWNPVEPKLMTKSFYINRFLSFKRREHQERMDWIQFEANMQLMKAHYIKKKICTFLLWSCFGRPYEWIMQLLFLLFTILAVIKLDGRLQAASWAHIFIPFFVVITKFVYTNILFKFVRIIFRRHHFNYRDAFRLISWVYPLTAYAVYITPLYIDKKLKFFLFSAVSFATLALIHLSSTISGFLSLDAISFLNNYWWPSSFLLISLFFFLGLIHAISSRNIRTVTIDIIFEYLSVFFCMLFVVFCHLKINAQITWDWEVVFAPLFAAKALYLVFFLGVTLWYFFTGKIISPSLGNNFTVLFFTGLILLLFIYFPLFLFELLVSRKLQGTTTISWAKVFSPFFVLEGFIFLSILFFNLLFSSYDESEW